MLSRRNLAGVAVLIVLGALFVSIVRKAPEGSFSRILTGDLRLLALGFLLFVAACGARALRLLLLLGDSSPVGFARAASLSGGASFLLHVVPFRGGDVGAWALYRQVLGTSWPRAGSLYALLKLIDLWSTTALGLLGGSLLLARHGREGLAGALAAAAALVTLCVVLLPATGVRLLGRLASFLPDGSTARRTAQEIVAGLGTAHLKPRPWAGVLGTALLYAALQVAGLTAAFRGLGAPVSPAGAAFATLSAVVVSWIPSPAGTFGPAEAGLAAALALDGVSVPLGAAAAVLAHLLVVAAVGAVGLPLFLTRRSAASENEANERRTP